MSCFLQILALSCLVGQRSQSQNDFEHIPAVTLQYADYLSADTTPSYGLAKVKALVSKLKGPPNALPEPLADKTFYSLSTEEGFTYCMIHGEWFAQNCAMMPLVLHEERKISSHPMGTMGRNSLLSKRQTEFLKSHRAEVIDLLRGTMLEKGRVGCNLKMAILELDAFELIPVMVKVYDKDHKDGDILSTFFVLMTDGKYQPFMKSATYQKLHGLDGSYQSYVAFTKANADMTIQEAMAFYKSRVR